MAENFTARGSRRIRPGGTSTGRLIHCFEFHGLSRMVAAEFCNKPPTPNLDKSNEKVPAHMCALLRTHAHERHYHPVSNEPGKMLTTEWCVAE